MGQLYPSETKSFDGPFILDKDSLQSLHTTLEQVIDLLEEGLLRIVEEKADEIIENGIESGKQPLSREKARNLVKDRHAFKRKETSMELISTDDSKLKDNSILSLLKDPKSELLSPVSLNINIQRGPCLFKMEIICSGDRGGIDVEVLCNDPGVNSDIWHLIQNWIEANNQDIISRFYSSIAIPAKIFLFIAIIVMTFIDLLGTGTTREAQYNSSLTDSVRTILNNGIDSAEVPFALYAMLRYQTKTIPEGFVAKDDGTTNGISRNTILVTLSFFFSLGSPKTVIGIGKRKSRALFYKYWHKVFIVWLPGAILAPWIWDRFFP